MFKIFTLAHLKLVLFYAVIRVNRWRLSYFINVGNANFILQLHNCVNSDCYGYFLRFSEMELTYGIEKTFL